MVAPLPSPGTQGKDTAAPPFCDGQTVGPRARDPPTINVFAQSLAAGGSHGSDCAKKKIGRFLRFACNFSVNMSPTSPYSCVPRGGVVIKIPHNRALELVLTQTTLPGIFCTIALAPQQKLHSPEGFHRCLDLRPRPTA